MPFLAHPPHGYDGLFLRWTWDPLVIAGLATSAALYARGARRVWARAGLFRGVRAWHVTSFGAGWLWLVLALISPLDALSDALFAAHMAQHEILMLVAAPLIVVGRPLSAMAWALPPAGRAAIAGVLALRPVERAWAFVSAPAAALLLHGLAVWIWHVPFAFEAAIANESVHAVQHLSFFLTAALFWWGMVHGRFGRAGYGLSVLFVFATALHTSILGALLSLGQRLWYPDTAAWTREYGLEPIEDQQLAGLIMWIPSGFVFVLIAIALFAAWIGAAERGRLRAVNPSGIGKSA